MISSTQSNDGKKLFSLVTAIVRAFNLASPNEYIISIDSKASENDDRILGLNFDTSGDNLWNHRLRGPELWSISSKNRIAFEKFSLSSPYALPSSDNSFVVCFRDSEIRIYYFNKQTGLEKIQIDNGSKIDL